MLNSSYVSGLYLMGSPMCRTTGLGARLGRESGGNRDGMTTFFPLGVKLGIGGWTGEADRGELPGTGVLPGIGVFVGSAMVKMRGSDGCCVAVRTWHEGKQTKGQGPTTVRKEDWQHSSRYIVLVVQYQDTQPLVVGRNTAMDPMMRLSTSRCETGTAEQRQMHESQQGAAAEDKGCCSLRMTRRRVAEVNLGRLACMSPSSSSGG